MAVQAIRRLTLPSSGSAYGRPLKSNVRAHMSTPRCPTCREGMSSVEEGLGGVWSCLYCEGTWLSPSQLQAAAAVGGETPGASALVSTLEVSPSAESLPCPACFATNLKTVSFGSAIAHHCPSCGGAFFTKGVVAACAPQVFSSSQEAPVVAALLGTIGAAALLSDPSLLIAALAYQPQGVRVRPNPSFKRTRLRRSA